MKKYKKTYYFEQSTYDKLQQIYMFFISKNQKKSLSAILAAAIDRYYTECKNSK